MTNDEPVVALAPRGKRPVGRPPKHGVYSKYALRPLEDAKIKEIVEVMRGEKLAIAPSDMMYVTLLGRLLAQITLMDRWLSEKGYFSDEGKGLPWPIVPHYLNLLKQAAKMLGDLGMTAVGRYRLGHVMMQTEDIASKILEAQS